MACKQEDLASCFRKINQQLGRRRRATVVKVNENVVPNQRHLNAVFLKGNDKRQTNRNEEKLARAARKSGDVERFAVRRVDIERVLTKRRPDIDVHSVRQTLEVARRLAQRLRLTFLFVSAANILHNLSRNGARLPQFRHFGKAKIGCNSVESATNRPLLRGNRVRLLAKTPGKLELAFEFGAESLDSRIQILNRNG